MLYYGMPHELVSHNHHDLCAIDLVVETAKSASVKLLQWHKCLQSCHPRVFCSHASNPAYAHYVNNGFQTAKVFLHSL